MSDNRVNRGSSWGNSFSRLRSAYRFNNDVWRTLNCLGFRVAATSAIQGNKSVKDWLCQELPQEFDNVLQRKESNNLTEKV